MKVLVAVPCMDTVPVEFTTSLVNLLSNGIPNNTAVRLCMKSNSLVYDSRNLLSLTAIEQGFDYVMWLDSDMVFNPDTVSYILKTVVENNYDMLTGVYYMRKAPHSPVLYSVIDEPALVDGYAQKKIQTMTDIPEDSTFQVEGCGFGCVMTSVSLLKQVWDKFGPAFNPYPWASEDMSFCYRVKLLGKKIWCDSSIPLGHIGTSVFDKSSYKKGE